MIEQLRRLFSTATLRESVSYQSLEKVFTYLLNREIIFKGKVDLTQADVRGLSSGSSSWDDIKDKPVSFPPSSHTHPEKQDTLVSGVNIKTVNTQSLLGSGDITISGGVTSVNAQTGVVVLDADDISDSATTNKFVTASDLTNLGNLSGVNSGDQDLSGLLPSTHLTDFAHADIAHANRAALDLVSGTNTGDEDLSGLVPYTGATTNVALGANTISTTSRVITPKVSPASDSTTSVQITRSNGSTVVMNVDTTNDRVGIGTTSPSAKFTISSSGGANSGINLNMTSASSYGTIDFNTPSGLVGQFLTTGASFSSGGFGGNELVLINQLSSGPLHIAAAGASGVIKFTSGGAAAANERVRITSSGNVGVNTTSPSAKLHVVGTLLNQKLVEANTAGSGSPNIIASTESGSVFTNEGATALNYHTLPTAVAGLVYTFYVQDADGIRVVANTGDTIRINTSVSASAGYAESTTIGSSVTLTAINATEWVATSVIGTWTLT